MGLLQRCKHVNNKANRTGFHIQILRAIFIVISMAFDILI